MIINIQSNLIEFHKEKLETGIKQCALYNSINHRSTMNIDATWVLRVTCSCPTVHQHLTKKFWPHSKGYGRLCFMGGIQWGSVQWSTIQGAQNKRALPVEAPYSDYSTSVQSSFSQ